MNIDERNRVVEEHYRKNYRRLFPELRKLGVMSRHDREDVIQEAYLRCLTFFHAFYNGESFDNWFDRILVNCANDKIADNNHHAREVPHKLTNIFDEAAVVNKIFIEKIRQYIHNFDTKVQQILLLYFFHELTLRELMSIFDMSRGYIAKVIVLHRNELRRVFGKDAFTTLLK